MDIKEWVAGASESDIEVLRKVRADKNLFKAVKLLYSAKQSRFDDIIGGGIKDIGTIMDGVVAVLNKPITLTSEIHGLDGKLAGMSVGQVNKGDTWGSATFSTNAKVYSALKDEYFVIPLYKISIGVNAVHSGKSPKELVDDVLRQNIKKYEPDVFFNYLLNPNVPFKLDSHMFSAAGSLADVYLNFLQSRETHEGESAKSIMIINKRLNSWKNENFHRFSNKMVFIGRNGNAVGLRQVGAKFEVLESTETSRLKLAVSLQK